MLVFGQLYCFSRWRVGQFCFSHFPSRRTTKNRLQIFLATCAPCSILFILLIHVGCALHTSSVDYIVLCKKYSSTFKKLYKLKLNILLQKNPGRHLVDSYSKKYVLKEKQKNSPQTTIKKS
jgi:hypothetical protein